MGEVGINPKEYLYELTFCEILLISRGYHARKHAGWEQARLIAYNARFAFGSKTTPPPVEDWLTFPWEQHPDQELDEDEVEDLRERIREENRKRGKEIRS